jgi:hypothetical protein
MLTATAATYVLADRHASVQRPARGPREYAIVLSTKQALCLFKTGSQSAILKVERREVKERKGVNEMLSIEIIGVLGSLFGFLIYGLVKTQLASRQAETKQKIAWEGR